MTCPMAYRGNRRFCHTIEDVTHAKLPIRLQVRCDRFMLRPSQGCALRYITRRHWRAYLSVHANISDSLSHLSERALT